jgi:hypothetical protein
MLVSACESTRRHNPQRHRYTLEISEFTVSFHILSVHYHPVNILYNLNYFKRPCPWGSPGLNWGQSGRSVKVATHLHVECL